MKDQRQSSRFDQYFENKTKLWPFQSLCWLINVANFIMVISLHLVLKDIPSMSALLICELTTIYHFM